MSQCGSICRLPLVACIADKATVLWHHQLIEKDKKGRLELQFQDDWCNF